MCKILCASLMSCISSQNLFQNNRAMAPMVSSTPRRRCNPPVHGSAPNGKPRWCSSPKIEPAPHIFLNGRLRDSMGPPYSSKASPAPLVKPRRTKGPQQEKRTSKAEPGLEPTVQTNGEPDRKAASTSERPMRRGVCKNTIRTASPGPSSMDPIMASVTGTGGKPKAVKPITMTGGAAPGTGTQASGFIPVFI